MKKTTLKLLFYSVAFGLITASASAAPILFNGIDFGANSNVPHPNSITAASAFEAASGALGTVNLIDFESAPVGSFTSLLVTPGVTLSTTGIQSIRDSSLTFPDAVWGYNMTVGGSNFVFMGGSDVTFTFNTPIQAFGLDISGVQDAGETVVFSDGSSQTVNIPNPGSGVQFLGFTDANQTITSVTVNAPGDAIGIDNILYVYSVPEPSSLALSALGGLGGLLLFRRRK
jgi:hypothetical protein